MTLTFDKNLVYAIMIMSAILVFTFSSPPSVLAFPNQPLPPIPVGNCPQGVAVDTAASPVLLYVTNGCDNSVTVINEATAATIATISLPAGSSPIGIDVDKTNHIVYVADNTSTDCSIIKCPHGAVSIIDGTTSPPTLARTIAIAFSNPTEVVVDDGPSPPQIYVSDPGEGKVQVLSGSSAISVSISTAITSGLSASNAPTGIAFDKTNHLLFVDLNGTGGVKVYDCTTAPCSSTGTITDGAKGRMAVDPAHTKLYHVDRPNNQIFKDVYTVGPFAAGSTTAIAVGNSPEAIRVNPDTQFVYVSNGIDNTISVVDGTGANPTIAVPFPPLSEVRGLDLDKTNGRLFITFFGGGHGNLLGQMQITTLADIPPAGAPSAPQNPLIAPQSSTSVQLTWSAPSSQGSSGFSSSAYKISYGNPMIGDSSFTVLTGQSSPATITGLTSGQPYLFKIQAHDTAGYGLPATIPFFLSSGINTNNQFLPPPIDLSQSSNFAIMQAMLQKGAPQGFTLPSASFISSANFKPFDPTFQGQNVTFRNSADPASTVASLIASYGIQSYTPPGTWDNTHVWSVPPSIVPLTGVKGDAALFNPSQIQAGKPIYLPVTGASPLSNGAEIAGLQLNLAGLSTNPQIQQQFQDTPPSGDISVPNSAMYMHFSFTDTGATDFSNPNTYSNSNPPTLSFTVGPKANTIADPNTPTNSVNPAITCPKVTAGFVTSASFSTTGITVTRDTSGDTSSVCGYKATVPHFTDLSATTTPAPSAGHGGSTPGAPPSFTIGFSQNEYPLTINNNNYRLPNYTNTGPLSSITLSTPFTISVLLYGDNGLSSVKHVSLFTNIRGNYASLVNSDTVISWDATEPLQVSDPNHFFGPITANATVQGNKLEVTFHGTFDKPMLPSDIGIRTWGYDLYSRDIYVINALQSTASVETTKSTVGTSAQTVTMNPSTATQSPSTTSPSVATNTANTPANTSAPPNTTPANDLATTVKDWAGYSPTAISDSQMLQSMGYKGNHIPSWVMKNMAKYLVDGSITQDDFAGVIKYLHDNQIIR